MTFEYSNNLNNAVIDLLYNPPHPARENSVLDGYNFSAHDVALCSSEEARALLQSSDAIELVALPLGLVRGKEQLTLHIAVADSSESLRAKLRFLCGVDVILTEIPLEVLRQAIPKAYLGSESRLRRYINRIALSADSKSGAQGNNRAADVPVAKGDAAQFLTAILEFAAVRGASDLHLSPGVDTVVVKMRIDGELCSLEGDPYAKSFHEQVISRLKVLAALDLTTRRLPQDGAFRFMVGTTVRNARLSTLPSVHGESAVIRFLDGQSIPEINQLGLEPATLLVLRAALERTEGLLLFTGPTGSGKTTTMYCVVRELARRGLHVVTAEDPVENPLPGVVQVQVSTEQGLDYPRAIRSVLRHDPDALLIGEVRDAISAAMALDAASTGHLTISSLHVGSSLQAIGRLEVLGVSRARSIPAVALVVNQRLMSKLCGSCKQLDLERRNPELGRLYKSVGCDLCAGSGYRGRVLLTEVLDLRNQRAKDACYRANTTVELLDLLPVGSCIPWTESLQHHLLRGEISLQQIEQFVGSEMV
jgi:type IV pilus assembly protein PilB